MLKKVLTVFSFLLVSCATWTSGNRPLWPHDDAEVAESTYQVLVSQKIDIRILKKELPGLLDEAPDTFEQGWSGTGWVSGGTSGESHLMTAGHVCDTGKTMEVKDELLDIDVQLPILETTYTLKSRDDVEYTDVKVVLDDDALDLCMLKVHGDLGNPLMIADADPDYGDAVSTIGAPHAHWGGGVAMIVKGYFAGRGSMFEGYENHLHFSAFSGAGASGSAIMHGGKVIAVLVAGARDYQNLFVGVPWERITDFIYRAEHGQK